jgi:hypothetical protein
MAFLSGRPTRKARNRTCNSNRETALNWQKSADEIVRKLLQQLMEGLNQKETGNDAFVWRATTASISQESLRQGEAVTPERRVFRRHNSPLPLAKQRITCWSECSKEITLVSRKSGWYKTEERRCGPCNSSCIVS